ncbi:hypothetical protein N9L68_06490 [bacterium]|nr:hypothetical protein [bacterium]
MVSSVDLSFSNDLYDAHFLDADELGEVMPSPSTADVLDFSEETSYAHEPVELHMPIFCCHNSSQCIQAGSCLHYRREIIT